MKPILYDTLLMNLNSNGYGYLEECTDCYVDEERNGKYEATFKYPTKGLLYDKIQLGSYLKIKANDKDELQLFRVYHASKVMKGIQEFRCEHISYELNRAAIPPIKITSKNATQALQQIMNSSLTPPNFTVSSDITTVLSTEITKPVTIRTALGGIEGSMIDTWGGEYHWDNRKVELLRKRGELIDLRLSYGMNLRSLTKEESDDELYTAVMPYAVYKDEDDNEVVVMLEGTRYIKYSGITVTGQERIYIKDFSDKFNTSDVDNPNVPTPIKLNEEARKWMETNKLYLPKENIKFDFVKLEETTQYRDVVGFQKIGLCDLVTIVFDDFGIDEQYEIISVRYDSLLERYRTLEVGDKKGALNSSIQQLANEMKSASSLIGNLNIQGTIENAIQNATDQITGAKGGHVVLRPSTGPNEILIMDTDNVNTAKKVWRWNLGGLGYSKDGANGPYGLAMTMDGSINANYITSGILQGIQVYQYSSNGRKSVFLRNTSVELYDWYNEENKLVGELGTTANTSGTYEGRTSIMLYTDNGDIGDQPDNQVGIGFYTQKLNADGIKTVQPFIYSNLRFANDGTPQGRNGTPWLWMMYEPKALMNDSYFYGTNWVCGTMRYKSGFVTRFDDMDTSPVPRVKTFTGAIYTIPSSGAMHLFGKYETNIGVMASSATDDKPNVELVWDVKHAQITSWGNINMTGHTITNQSDERLKKNIHKKQISALDILNQIDVVEFDWLNDKHETIGIIAQQLEKAYPELVQEDERGVKTTDTMKLIYVLIKAIQELSNPVSLAAEEDYIETCNEKLDSVLLETPIIEVNEEEIEQPKAPVMKVIKE